MPTQHPNAGLIGAPVEALSTPYLMIDLPAFERNVAAMAAHCRKAGLKLRPHAKTHKSATIARAQIAAGAEGICVAKLGEAEALAAVGIDDILITSPVVTAPALRRLMSLSARMGRLTVVVDSIEGARRLAEAAEASDRRMRVLVDLDVGLHRTGIAPAGALALGEAIARSNALELAGLQAYAGQVMHIEGLEERRAKSHMALAQMAEVREAFRARGFACDVLSGGGTGTYDIDPEVGVLSELQAGSYIFMDHQYRVVGPAGGAWTFESALFVVTSIISANHPGLATTDAGLKAFATDAGVPVIAGGAPPGARYFFFGDEQGGIAYAEKTAQAKLGERAFCVVPHCDPTVNLYDAYHVVVDGRLEALWPIEARGRGL